MTLQAISEIALLTRDEVTVQTTSQTTWGVIPRVQGSIRQL